MPGAPTGLLGKLSAERPILVTGVLLLGALVLCLVGLREADSAESYSVLSNLVFAGLFVLCAPIMLAAFAPERPILRFAFLCVTIIAGAGLSAAALGAFEIPGVYFAPLIALSGFGLFMFLIVLAPLTRNAVRLGVAAPFAALIGAVGGLGVFAIQDILTSPLSAASVAIALAGGVTIGAGIGADFAQYFAKGMTPRKAAAAAGHGGVAPAAFCVLVAAAYAALTSFHANFGRINIMDVASAGSVVLLASLMALVGTTSALALRGAGEQTAVDENRRRQRFVESWKPVRKLLPSTTAFAVSAIAAIMVVIAGFEVGVETPGSLLAFIVVVLCVSGLAFVSIRTSLLIAVLLLLSTLFAHYLYEIFSLPKPDAPARFAALALAAIAFSQITVSWRNAGDIWRNARDVAQNAMCDGLRRFLVSLGAGSAALVASSAAFMWSEGGVTAAYLIIICSIGLLLSPAFMIALSARTQDY
ncbi:hypothetical protein [Hyphococcus sp.]|uniref:hypothetical protein n=1 Tax=Hyphococcus sp. TaxID=2038636 RepID=UPI003CCC27AA